MKIFITGVGGTGKSTIAKALNEKGFVSVDFSDNPELRYWQHKSTKERSEYSPDNNVGWFDEHECICDLDELEKLFAIHKDLVVTGVSTGIEAFHLFDKIILLQLSPETIRHRMATRDRIFGKKKEEQDNVIEWRKTFDPMVLSEGAVSISTEGTLEEVVTKVIAEISKE